MENLKIQFLSKIPSIEERNPELFYYDLRNSEVDNGYTIERKVLVNNIGSLVTNKDILGDKEFITDEDLEGMVYEEVTDLYIKQNSIESDMEM